MITKLLHKSRHFNMEFVFVAYIVLMLLFTVLKLAENLDLDNIITPVNPVKLNELLTEANYDSKKREYLVNGFTHGFKLHYQRPLNECKRLAPNLKLRIGSKEELWNKVMTEVELGRYAGPFQQPPFEHFVQSPIGLVPKDKGLKTRLIFHLSYPKDGDSVNSGIPHELCTVKYPDFDKVVKICLQEGEACFIGKSDMSSAFRHVPMSKDQWWLLVMKAEHPHTSKVLYFVDKCLPFGSSISCVIFQAISDAIAWLVRFKTHKNNVNYLDYYLFAAALKALCDWQIKIFLGICQDINFPVAMEKTYWGCNLLTFLSLLLDTRKQLIGIPMDKLIKAANWVHYFLNKKNKKAMLLEFQKLCGILNFLCRCIVPGRAFLGRLYAVTEGNSKLKAHHHIKITKENRSDLMVWQQFLMSPEGFYRPFMETVCINAAEIDMFSDASGNYKLGFGTYCEPEWTYGQWDEEFCSKVKPSIENLELFAVSIAIINWIKLFANRRIVLFCDNEAVVHMINNCSSSGKNCMVLMRIILVESMIRNVRIFAKHVGTKANGKADALSRLEFGRFYSLAGDSMNLKPSNIPQEIWPISKIWKY